MSFVAPFGYGYNAHALGGSWVRPSVLAGSYVAAPHWGGATAWNGLNAWNGASAWGGAWGAAPVSYAGAWGHPSVSYAAPAWGGYRSGAWW